MQNNDEHHQDEDHQKPVIRSNARFRTIFLWGLFFVAIIAAAAVAQLAFDRYRLRTIDVNAARALKPTIENGVVRVRIAEGRLLGELARFEDELFAYLMFDYLKSRPTLAGRDLLLTYTLTGSKVSYVIREALPDDFISGLSLLYESPTLFPFLTTEWSIVDNRVLAHYREQSRTFVSAYTFPSYRKLEHLTQAEIVAYTRRFIRFKSTTDPRIRRQIEPVPSALSKDEAEQLAEDIVLIAQFYQLPLEFFLGIGAMENNYMNVKGDIGNAIWKTAAAADDVILRRRNGHVLVLNEALGEWQITRETLRFAHALYLRDQRDYGKLPERLRPSKQLDVTGIDHVVLTTYAGILFRDLLDRFGGDRGKAIGAYNGGPGNPNARYEAGVRLVAQYARKTLEQAAALRGERVVNRRYFRSVPTPALTR